LVTSADLVSQPQQSIVQPLQSTQLSQPVVGSPFGCNQVDDLNCSDFRSIGQNANAHLAQCGDEDKLDQDGDGRACER
jgi:excalibur calcium-binding domain-containing protein